MSTKNTFQHNGRTYRLVRRIARIHEYGYAEPGIEHFNVLQVRRSLLQTLLTLSRWETVEEEHVPGHVVITLGCFGDTGGWTSALAERCRRELGMA